MSIANNLTEDLKTAMKEHNKVSLNVIRSLKTALTNEKVSVGHDLTDEEELTVITREVKQVKESIAEFKNGGRDDLVAEQEQQLEVLSKYAPEQMSKEEIDKVVEETINEVGASAMSDFGKVMGAIMPKVKGKADGNEVNQSVKAHLS
ncbi:MAG: GatB/YqeY domain-containing protein [Apilactobacillus sp.]|uniref:GatB/YqeY domain-containing protein n=1 Tax=Apilactobacillus TaxID=2767877 RepID=UPI0025E837B8|nr:GatB/YqeY domain-containing protein [Apilactobacillus sp.]MCT6822440.1 GatB/YqeY domain-containing protein [Apilactobacillus sp.]MCT6857802.1 GatB/YqeY domain-containing protein [Apilactobacillus sp.]